MRDKQDIYKMKLGDVFYGFDVSGNDQGRVSVLRVPGGWVFTTYRQGNLSSVFVPWLGDNIPF